MRIWTSATPGQSMFYFIPYFPPPPAFSVVDEREIGLNTAILAETVRNLPARRIVLVIDACQSGGAIESLAKVGEVKVAVEKRRAALEATNNPVRHNPDVGVYILAAATPVQEAAEPVPGTKTDSIKHSLLTAALLDTLQKIPNSTGDKLWMSDLMRGVRSRLSELAMARKWTQTPLFVSVGDSDFPVAIR